MPEPIEYMPGLIDRVYEVSPMWAQRAMVAAYGAWWYRRRFGPQFHRLVAGFSARDRWSADAFREYQALHLARLFASAAASPHYGPLLRVMDVSFPLEALGSLPLLSKETLRTSARELLTRTPPRGVMVQRSSGTTGTPTEIYYSREFHALELAVPEARSLLWAGASYRDRRVMFGARKICHWGQDQPPFWRTSPVEDMTYCSIYHLSPRFMGSYVKFLGRYRPKVVMGYPSALATLARFAQESGGGLPPARAVITTSETLSAEARAAIEHAWACKVWDRYGAVEGCLFASQCERGAYHVAPDVGIVEILDKEARPCAPGVIGEVVATGLHNTLQPLIRYRLGDAARWSADQHCGCGRSMPVIEAVEGRIEDMCITPDGRSVLRFDTVFKGVANIKEAQVIQRAPDAFEIRIVPDDRFVAEDARLLESNMHLHVGSVHTSIVQVPSIARTPSGKFRAVICDLTPEQRMALQPASAQMIRE